MTTIVEAMTNATQALQDAAAQYLAMAALTRGDIAAALAAAQAIDASVTDLKSAIAVLARKAQFTAPAAGIIARDSGTILNSGVNTDVTSWGSVTNTLATSVFNNGTFTVGAGEGGSYLCSAGFRFAATYNAFNIFGTITNNAGALAFNQAFNPTSADTYGGIFLAGFSKLAVGDQLKFTALQANSGGFARSFSAANFNLIRIGA